MRGNGALYSGPSEAHAGNVHQEKMSSNLDLSDLCALLQLSSPNCDGPHCAIRNLAVRVRLLNPRPLGRRSLQRPRSAKPELGA